MTEDSEAMPPATLTHVPLPVVETACFKFGMAAIAVVAGISAAIFIAWLVGRRRRSEALRNGITWRFSKRQSRPPSSILYPEAAHCRVRTREEMVQSPNSFIENTTWSIYTPEDPYRIMQDCPVAKAAQVNQTRVEVMEEEIRPRDLAQRNRAGDDGRRNGRVGIWPASWSEEDLEGRSFE